MNSLPLIKSIFIMTFFHNPQQRVIILISFFSVIFFSCNKHDSFSCPDSVRVFAPIKVNILNSRMKLSDTLTFKIEVPFKNISVRGDSMNLSGFRDFWGGFSVYEYIKDSVLSLGGIINSISSRKAFRYFTSTNIFEIPKNEYIESLPGRQPSSSAIFFKYQKRQDRFILNLHVIPTKKGTFTFNFLSSGFRDAPCLNKANHDILEYRYESYLFLLEEAIGKPLADGVILERPIIYIIHVE